MKRDLRLDYIRVIGILLVILAHTSLNNYVSNIRTFDVAMLVCVAGASYTYSKPIHSCKDYITYIKKRFIRLVVPVWFFLTFYFILTAFMKGEMVYSISTMTSTYLLINGIGYVWIFRIMLMMALINPFLKMISDKIDDSFGKSLIVEFVLILINELLVLVCLYIFKDSIVFKLIKMTICYFIGYGILSLMGMLFLKLSQKNLIKLIVVNGLFVIASIVMYGRFSPSDYKYPPMMQFISFGLFACFLFYIIFSHIKIVNIKTNDCIIWLSKHSLNVYLCHILVIFLLGYYGVEFFPLIHYIVVITLSIVLTYMYYFIKERLLHGKC